VAVEFDFAKVIARSRGVADQMAKGIEFLFKKNKVDAFIGRAQVSVPGMVEIVDGRRGKIPQGRARAHRDGLQGALFPGVEVDGERVMTSREALVMKNVRSRSSSSRGSDRRGVRLFLNAFGQR